jgi:hypothetical protein
MLYEFEKLAKWEPVEGITFDFSSAEVYSMHPDMWVRLIDGRVGVAEHQDLIFHFTRVAGYTVHEEFAHPTQGTVWGREPIISADRKATFPCLIVTGSAWFKLLEPEIQISYAGAVHYRLRSSFPVIDVVSANAPGAKWFRRPVSAQNIPGPEWASEG